MSIFYRAQAVYASHLNAKQGDGTNFYDVDGNIVSLDETKISIKQKEIEDIEAIRLLREERNKRLVETDWRFRVDMTPSQEWKDYCEALRDLPSTASPKIENEKLTNVTWPTEPE